MASVPAERDRARLGGRGDTALIRRRLRQRRRLMAPVGPCRRWAASAGAARPGARGPCGCRGRCPGVRAKATGRPVTQGPGHGPCWSRPPARGRPPPARPPCCGLRRAMSLDAGACDAGPLMRGLGSESSSGTGPTAAVRSNLRGQRPRRDQRRSGCAPPVHRRGRPMALGPSRRRPPVLRPQRRPEITRRPSSRGLPSTPRGRCGARAAQATSESQTGCNRTLLPTDPRQAEERHEKAAERTGSRPGLGTCKRAGDAGRRRPCNSHSWKPEGSTWRGDQPGRAEAPPSACA